MDIDSLQARIAHESAELRACCPHLTDCSTALIQWLDAGRKRYSLKLDLRWPEHQTLVSGEAMDDAGSAIAAAFADARRRVLSAPIRR